VSVNGVERVVVIRHGETEWSAALRHTGRTDVPLAPAGRARAAELYEALDGRPFDRVLVSPLRRARETCELAGFTERAEISPDLQEWDYGDYEGLTTAEIREHRPGWSVWRDGCPGGEPLSDIAARADRVIELLCEGPDTTALLFAHGHFLRILAARWVAIDPTGGARFVLAPGSLGVLGHERETRAIVRWNALSLD
jgi:broad specificity phosphatase PhoE